MDSKVVLRRVATKNSLEAARRVNEATNEWMDAEQDTTNMINAKVQRR